MLKNSPHINISLYYQSVDSNIFKDYKFVQLMNLLIKKENINKYIYGLYTDSDGLGDNLLVPVFHTLYLGCRNNNVVISDIQDLWLIELYPNNTYYYLLNMDDSNKNSLLNQYKITLIKHLEEIK